MIKEIKKYALIIISILAGFFYLLYRREQNKNTTSNINFAEKEAINNAEKENEKAISGGPVNVANAIADKLDRGNK